MTAIELEIWEPNPEDPRYLRYVGQPITEEVFHALEQRLIEQGWLPDEYFLMDMDWEHGREIPKGADIFCTTDWGSSEGVYVDVYLKWHEDGKPVIKSFATGKTLGETNYDFDRMFLTASAITKVFHGEGQKNRIAPGAILCLNAEEKNTLSEILTQQEQCPEVNNLLTKLGMEPQEQTQTQSSMTIGMSLT